MERHPQPVLGFHRLEHHDGYLLLRSGDVELHFSLHDDAVTGQCFLHVADATKLWKQLSDQAVTGLGPIAAQDHGLSEFVLTDPDGNRIRIGSPPSERRDTPTIAAMAAPSSWCSDGARMFGSRRASTELFQHGNDLTTCAGPAGLITPPQTSTDA